jgi:hypothetical protein
MRESKIPVRIPCNAEPLGAGGKEIDAVAEDGSGIVIDG